MCVSKTVDGEFYQATCYVRGTSLAATYEYVDAVKSEYTYYLQNAHGDVVNLTDDDGAVTKTYKYDAFGVEKNISDTDTNAFRYCGEYYDSETGTIYLRARYYNPSTGRFTQRDSFAGRRDDPLSLNLYAYCRNNPILYFDPSGHGIGDFFSNFESNWKRGVSIISKKSRSNPLVKGVEGALETRTKQKTDKQGALIDAEPFRNNESWADYDVMQGNDIMTYLGVHKVGLGNYHSSVIIFASQNSEFWDNDKFSRHSAFGGNVRYATLGAGSSLPIPIGGDLKSGINRKKDVMLDIKVEMINLNVSNAETIYNLFELEERYANKDIKTPYTLIPRKEYQYNSNSFAHGLLNVAGIDIPRNPSYKVPGWQNPLQNYHFPLPQ